MAAKKQPTRRGTSQAAKRNKAVDDLDLAGELDLPPAADTSLSPLAASAGPSPDETASADSSAEQRPDSGRRDRTSEEGKAPTGRRRKTRGSKRAPVDETVESARESRDAERDRLVREALEARGQNPDQLLPRTIPKGGKHRPTIELTPNEYAAINVANAVRPDLFDSTLVGFVRTCANNWEKIAEVLDDET